MRSEEPVSRIMTETVVVIDADRPVGEVRECFSQYPIHHLPVVRDGRLVGMLSSADVSKLEFGTHKAAANDASGAGGGITIASLMQSSPIRLGPHASIGEAAERLVASGVHAVPIVDDADRVIGIVTTSDVIRSLLHGPPRRGVLPPSRPAPAPASTDPEDEPQYQRKPTDAEYLVALQTAEVLHVEARDLRHLGKTLLYLDQRRRYLEKVLELADRFLLTGQDEHVHALLLKAIHAAKRAEEHAGGGAGTPFPLE
jgi:CBS domain-containing protein